MSCYCLLLCLFARVHHTHVAILLYVGQRCGARRAGRLKRRCANAHIAAVAVVGASTRGGRRSSTRMERNKGEVLQEAGGPDRAVDSRKRQRLREAVSCCVCFVCLLLFVCLFFCWGKASKNHFDFEFDVDVDFDVLC